MGGCGGEEYGKHTYRNRTWMAVDHMISHMTRLMK